MAASAGSDSDKNNRKDAELASKEEKSDAAGGGSGTAAAVGNGGGGGSGTATAAGSGGGGGGGTSATPPTAAAVAAAAAVSGKERDYIWSEDAVHVLLDHFLEKYMSYEKGMIRNADWVEIAARVNQQLEGNKPVKTPEQCKNKVDNLKKQYRKERRRGSLGPASTNWSFFSRMHDIFESDYKKAGGGAAAAMDPGADEAGANDEASVPSRPTRTGAAAAAAAAAAATAAPVHDHYMASREFARKEDLYSKRPQFRRSETPPPPAPPPAPLMLLPPPDQHLHHHHHHRDRERERDYAEPARKKPKGGGSDSHQRHSYHHHHHAQPVPPAPPPPPQEQSGPPSSDSGGGGGGGGGGGVGASGGGGGGGERTSSKLERKLQRHQLAALRRDFMEGFTGFAEVMLKIEVAKMEMQRDLERQRAEMELHRTQMMLSNQLQLAKYLKGSPFAVNPTQPPSHEGGFWPNFGFAEAPCGGPNAVAGGSSNAGGSSSSGTKIQLAIPIFPGFTALDAVGPYEVLHLLPNVEVLFVSHEPGLYAAGMGMLTLQATASFDQVPRPQILVVPGGTGTRRLLQDRVILDWIRKVHEHTMYTASVCTGSLLLGAAGLLRGVEATTHWNSHDMLAEFGAKPVSKRIVRQGKIITAAGVSAGIDMALQLAAYVTDEATAKMLQLYIEYDPQPPFDTGSVSKAGPELTNRAKELSAKLKTAAA